eukprot:gene3852-4209_t
MTWSPDASTYSIFTTFALNFGIAIICILIFELLRNNKVDIYAPKLRKKPIGNQLPKPNEGWFGWIIPVWNASDDDMLKFVGMDAYVLLRHFKMCFKICSVCAFFAVILLGVYYTAYQPDIDDDANKVIGIALFSMANIPNEGDRLWASVVFVYLFTFVFLYLIDEEYANFALQRAHYSANGDDGLPNQMHYSVQIENIPPDFRTSPKLKQFVNNLFPGEVLYSYVAISLAPLEKLVAQRDHMLSKLEDNIAIYEGSLQTYRPQAYLKNGVLSNSFNCDECVDAIEFLTDQIAILSAEICDLQMEAKLAEMGEESRLNNDQSPWLRLADTLHLSDALKAVEETKATEYLRKVSSKIADHRIITAITDIHGTIASRLISATGFVTFRSQRTQAVAVGLPSLSAEFPDLTVGPAPAPTDIIWSNLDASTERTEATTYITSAMYYTGLLFWTAVLTFIAGLSNLSELAQYMPFLNSLDDGAYAFLQGILPVVVMMIFLSLVPYAMSLISTFVERRKTISGVQEQVFQWFFLYQIANVYLLLLAGSAVTSVSAIIDDPANVLYTISTALPTTSVFFMNYIITTALTGITTNYLQFWSLLYFVVVRIFYPGDRLTRRKLVEGPLAKISVNYGATLPEGLYVLTIFLLYWVIAPCTVYLAWGYFGAGYLCWKYQMLYVVERNFESGGKFWYGLYTYSMVALLASTVTMIAYMSIKQGVSQAPALLPLLPIIIYQWKRTEGRYKALSMITPYSVAVQADVKAQAEGTVDAFNENYLKQPCLISPTRVFPYPYRIDAIPLLDDRGCLNEIYLSDEPPAYARPPLIGPSGSRDYLPPEDINAVEAGTVTTYGSSGVINALHMDHPNAAQSQKTKGSAEVKTTAIKAKK